MTSGNGAMAWRSRSSTPASVSRYRRCSVPYSSPASRTGVRARSSSSRSTLCAQLLAFVRRQLELRERLGEIPEGWLEPAEILNEVVTAALGERPGAAGQNRGRWLLLLTAQAIRQAVKNYGDRRHGLEVE